MKSLDETSFKKDLIDRISHQDSVFNIIDILRECFFTESQHRCLVLQHIDNYAVLFLKPETFDWQQERSRHVSELWELVLLVQELKDKGAIHSINGLEREKNIEVTYSSYEKVILNREKLTFNQSGDYSVEPHTILDREDQVKFKGVVFKGDYYYSLLDSLSGLFVKSKLFDSIVNSDDDAAKSDHDKLNKQEHASISSKGHSKLLKLAIGLILGLLLIITSSALVSYNISDHFNDQLSTIQSKNDSILLNLGHFNSNHSYEAVKPSNQVQSTNVAVSSESNKSLYGIDISHYQGDIIKELKLSDSISFVICKATQGLYYVDPYFKSNWLTLKEKNITRGAYHFYVIGQNPETQAQHFLKEIQDFGKDDIPLIVDIEMLSIPKNPSPNNINTDTINNHLLHFLDVIENATNRKPIVYTSNAFSDKYLTNEKLAEYPLWLAEYTKSSRPRIPEIWKDKGFRIWQRSDNYSVASSHTDYDVFYGKLEDLIR